jgi:hypothetical protein
MTITEIAIFVGIAAAAILTQLGRRQVNLGRFLLPLAAVAVAGYSYLHTIPTVGGDLDFELLCTAAGVAFGLLAAALVKVERDGKTGAVMLEAGLGYAAVWVLVFGSRLAFAWLATNAWRNQVGQFAIQHDITSSAAWTAALVLMALAMVLTRTVVLGARAVLAGRTGSEEFRVAA